MMRLLFAILCFLSYIINAQPLVHQEPHHIPVFQSKHVRVLYVTAAENDTTQFHVHKNDIGYFAIRGSLIWIQEFNQTPRVVNLPSGWSGSDITHSDNPIIHRFANLGEKPLHLVAVEILTEKYEGRRFSDFGPVLFTNSRFSIQEADRYPEINKSDAPFIIIELDQWNEIRYLDLVKPGRKLDNEVRDKSARIVIIQFK